MQNKTVKVGVGVDVQPVGNFLSNLVFEAARRMVRNAERIDMLIEEFIKRFKLSPTDVYTLMSELQKLGFDVTPNEWLYFTPVENRVAFLQTFVKNAKVYGSRYEDIMVAIEDMNNEIIITKQWLKQNEDARQLNPQSYIPYYQKLQVLENNKKKLEETKKLALASTVYDTNYKSGLAPMTLLNIAVGDDVYAICKTAENAIAQSPISDISTQSTLDETKEVDSDDQTQAISLSKAYENLKQDDALKPFFNAFTNLQGSDFNTPEVIAENLNALLDYIDKAKSGKTADEEEVNDAFKAIKTFVDARQAEGIELKTRVGEYIDESITHELPEDADAINKEQTGEFAPEATPGGIPPVAQDQGAMPKTVTMNSILPLKMAGDKDVAKAMLFIDKIARLLDSVQQSTSIPKTAHVDVAIKSIQGSLVNIKNYMQENLPYNSPEEKRAALIVLSNINKKLSSLIDIYTEAKSEDEFMKYIAASDFMSVLKTTNTLLTTLGE